MVRAVVCNNIGEPVSVENLSLPPLGPHDVLVRTDAAGVCHTDLSAAKGLTLSQAPIVLGHEGAGTVLEIGKNVTRCKPGDRVIMSWAPQCGVCYHCVRHEAQHCDESWGIRSSRHALRNDGAKVPTMAGLGTFAEMMQVNELSLVAVKSELPAEQLAMIGCGVTTGVGAALWTAEVKPGSTVAVFGCGGVGLSVIQGARIAGAMRIFAVDTLASKRELAMKFGATDAIDPAQGDVAQQLIAATGGRGVDYAFEVVGIPELLLTAFNSLRKHGTAVAVGMPKADATVSIPIVPLFIQEKRLVGSFYGSAQVREHFPLLVQLAERGRLDLASMISKRIGLEDVNAAFDAMKAGEVVRSVVLPNG
ncbi:Zn-dependent alcohol dehydrogenase [Azoarcus sp. DN11]|uniref:Zn-dependent alcohol dehydrogenase n=1 Tax=Azoarcus sp. DN11 TaxID=356837 RepID=UPI000EB2E2F7|nr:Zn-dependent alcohol dehydrogenase [Azoarcus sp. DN11]AYH43541.1 alcohol dehydrogenase [Azoarcus sp. DN11]